MKDTNKTSQLSDILGISHQVRESTQPESISEPSPSVTKSSADGSKKKTASWADDSKKRMLLAAGIIAIPTFAFIGVYGSAFNLKTAWENREAPAEIAEETVDIELAESEKVDENLRGIIAIGEQYDAIAKIESTKPKPTPEIKLEAKEPEPETGSVKVPDSNPQPVAQPRQPIVRQNPIRTVSKPKPTQVKSVPTPQYDSMSDWFELASSGSYGLKTTNQNERGFLAINSPVNTPKAQLVNNITATATSAPQKDSNLSTEEENFLKLLDYREPQQTVEVKKHQVALAQQVEARLVTGINWVGGDRQRVFVRLSEPLLDTQGNIQIPEDSMLVYEIDNVNGGIVQGQVVSLIDAGEEIPLPKGAISVLDKKGKMLAAKFKEFKHNGSSDALSFALGAARGTRDLISQPDSSFSSISQFGQSQGTNYANKNYPGTVLSGGATEVLENRLDEVQRRRNTSPITSFWQIEADTKVKLQTNYTFKY